MESNGLTNKTIKLVLFYSSSSYLYNSRTSCTITEIIDTAGDGNRNTDFYYFNGKPGNFLINVIPRFDKQDIDGDGIPNKVDACAFVAGSKVKNGCLLRDCREGLELVFKSSNEQPHCVTPSTALKLVEKEWARR